MKKTVLLDNILSKRKHDKIFLVMKLTIASIFLVVSQLFASEVISQKKVTLKIQNASLKQVFVEIEKKTSYRFVFNDDIIPADRKVNVEANNENVTDVLDRILTNTSLVYKIPSETVIVIAPKADFAVNASPPKVITGRVLNERGEPLEGASVKAKGGTKGVVTNSNGEFKIQVDDAKVKVLVVSYTGYVQQEIGVTKSNYTITMVALVDNLKDVVVIGYGTVRKKDVTVAVSRVNVEDLQKAPVMSFDQALAGRVTGVQVVSQDGQPGASVNIVIRGNNSLTQDNSPLYVIDGFPIENPDNNVINPAEIESLEVLKDASATAIYGARGANGVILITTKKGKTGPPKIDFQVFRSTQKVLKRVELMSPYEYVQYMYELNPANTLITYLRNVADDPVQIDSVMNLYKKLKGADFQDAVFGRAAPFVNYNLAVRGGTDKTKYNLAVNYADQEGVVINSGFKRYQLKSNIDQSISSKLKVGLNTTLTYINQYGVNSAGSGTSGLSGGTSYLMASVWGYRPVSYSGNIDSLLELPNDAEVDQTNTSTIYNPLYSTINEYHQNNQINLFANGYLDYQLTPQLKLRLAAGVNQTNNRRENFFNSQTSKGRINATNVNGVNGDYNITSLTNITNENTLTYSNTFNRDHHLNVLAGLTSQSSISKVNAGSATNIPNESLVMSGLSQGIPGLATVGSSKNTLVSLLSRVQYDYKSTYLLTASYRADGSSKFSDQNKWSYFPSFSVAWRFSKEDFMHSLRFVDDAKIRFGYGATGNNRVSDFVTFSSMSSGYTPVNSSFTYITNLGTLGNKSLKWETTTQSDLGLDLDLFKGKVNVTIDVYRKVTSDLLLNAQLPGSSGFGTGFKNIGKISNQGLEIAINTDNIKNKNFTWSTSFNISFNRNKVLELAENQEYQYGFVSWNSNYNSSPLYIAKLGQTLGQMFGYVSDGVYQYSDFNKSPSGIYTLRSDVPTSYSTRSTLPTPGSVKLKDLNGDGVITTADRTIIGRANPIHTGGFINNFTYKNFDLSIFFQWSYGNDIYNANRLIFENGSPNNPYNSISMFKSYANRWSLTNQTNDMPKANSSSPGSYYWSRCVEDGSYIRLKTLSLGYSLSKKTLKMMRNVIGGLKVYVSTQNLLTISSYTGFDPEVNSRPSALTPGFDYSVYPRANTITFGINANF